ncbi:MAG: hypothetical protein NT172_01995 [Planctomycetota bacterium]|nr:hypothetical protein [Planctomycetota bacterium]
MNVSIHSPTPAKPESYSSQTSFQPIELEMSARLNLFKTTDAIPIPKENNLAGGRVQLFLTFFISFDQGFGILCPIRNVQSILSSRAALSSGFALQ